MDSEISSALKKKRILVIDDQGSIRVVFQSFLREIGFSRVDCAMDGEDGIRHLESTPYDIVLCDWVMPKLSGYELLQTIRASEELKTLPFVMVTSSSETEDVRNAMTAGVSDYLIKPFQPLQLKQKVLQLLGTSQHKAQRLKPKEVDLTPEFKEDDEATPAPVETQEINTETVQSSQ